MWLQCTHYIIYKRTLFAGADYNQQSVVPVTINAGTTMQQFTINITDDNIIECTEAFTLSIEGTWCGLNSSEGRARVIIIDDDGNNL